MIQVAWMYGDAGNCLLGQAAARRNPLRWTRSAAVPEVVAELERLPDRGRPIRIKVRNSQDKADQQERSTTRVEQVFAGADGAVAALRSLCNCLPSEVVSGVTPTCTPNSAVSGLASSSKSDPDGTESFYSVMETPTGEDPHLVRGGSKSSTAVVGSSPMAVLRSHLRTGLPVLAKWMWGDAGLTAVLPQYAMLAESNPWRWSRPQSLEQTMAELDEHLATSHAQRPVRLQIWSSTSTNGEDDKCITFATTAQNVAFASSIIMEINFMVRAIDEQEEGAQLDLDADLCSSVDCFESCHSFATEAMQLREVSRSRSISTILGEPLPGSPAEPEPQPRSPQRQQQLGGPAGACGGAVGQLGHAQPPTVAQPTLKKRPSSNSNRVSQYRWLTELLQMITDGSNQNACQDLDAKQSATPLFIVAGFCPNSFAGMQAVVYCHLARGVDFWWAKPQEDHPDHLERKTLDLHSFGKHKNAAGKSRAVYAPLAEKFRGVADHGDFAFGVDGGRAFIEERSAGADSQGQRMLIYFVWQESWSSLFARRKFIEGKICYQRSRPDMQPEARFFARQYRIEDGRLDIAAADCEEEVTSLLPPDSFQEMYEM